jgi:hypothetical protein
MQDQLPPPPEFIPLTHLRDLHQGYNRLPMWLHKFDVISPIQLFDFLVPDDLITDIIKNTNAHAKKSIANQLSIDKSYKFYYLVDKGYVWDFHPPSNAVGLDLIP